MAQEVEVSDNIKDEFDAAFESEQFNQGTDKQEVALWGAQWAFERAQAVHPRQADCAPLCGMCAVRNNIRAVAKSLSGA